MNIFPLDLRSIDLTEEPTVSRSDALQLDAQSLSTDTRTESMIADDSSITKRHGNELPPANRTIPTMSMNIESTEEPLSVVCGPDHHDQSTEESSDVMLDPISYTPVFLPTEEDQPSENTLRGTKSAILRNKAKSLYFHLNQSVTDISENLDVPISDVRYYVYGSDPSAWDRNPKCWAYQRQYSTDISIAKYELIEPMLVKSSMKSALTVLDKNLIKLDETDETLDVKEMGGLVTIYSSLDKINRLTEGKATENIGVDRSTWNMREIMEERRNNHPFINGDDEEIELDTSLYQDQPTEADVVEDVEYTELGDDDE